MISCVVSHYNIIIQDGGGRHVKFRLSLITRSLLHIFARNLARILRLLTYIQECQNIEQK